MATANKPAPGSELATKADNLAAYDEDLLKFFGEAKGEGLEKVGADDVVIPRLVIIQALSPQVKARTAGPGDLFDIITGANYGQKGVKFVPLFFWGSRTQWSSPDPGADILCAARDGEKGSMKDAAHGGGICLECPQRQFTMKDGKTVMPSCTEYKNLLLVPVPDGQNYRDEHPVAFSAKRTSIGAMKNFLTACKGFRINGVELPFYSHVWQLRSQEEKNEKGDYYTAAFDDLGLIKDMNMLRYFQGVCREMKQIQDRLYVPEDNTAEPSSGGGEVIDAQFVADQKY